VTAKLPIVDESTLLEIAGRWLRALTDGSGEVVALADREGRVLYLSVSGAAQQMLGYSAREVAARGHQQLLHAGDVERVLSAFHEVAARPGYRITVNYRLRHESGHWIQVQSTAVNRLDDPVVCAIVVHTRKLPAQPGLASLPPENDEERPSEAVPLSVGRGQMPTGAAGRAALLRAIEEAVQLAAMDPSSGFAVLLVEFERSKMLLGNYGQVVVARLMDQAGKRLASVLGPGDAYCQLEAGELAVLLQGAGERGRAEALAQRVQQALSRRYHVDGETIATGVIVGIATSERRYSSAEHVLRDASLAATRARGPGRQGRAVFQTKMRIEDTKYMALVSALHGALQGGQLRVHYQPIVSLATRTLAGFEALVRWQHPERGLLAPAEFIRAAEETGLIVPMDRWVMREASRQMAQWNALFSSNPPLHVSVNLSATQVGDELEEHVGRILHDSGLAPQQLKLEVTESAVLENPETVGVRIQRLKSLGVKLALDDFGTGYSSFSNLCQLPYDTLKIDQSFVARLGEGVGNTEIVNAIVVLAHNLRMDVVAEGVETPKQAAQLKTLWCEYAQGYFFARPMDAEAAGALIASCPQW
jgi:PAS domain S-box-containing protein